MCLKAITSFTYNDIIIEFVPELAGQDDDEAFFCAQFPLLLPDRSPLLTNTTNTAAYLKSTSQLAHGSSRSSTTYWNMSTHAALPAKISARFALVISPTLSAKATVKAHIMPRIAAREFTKDRLVIGPTSKIIAAIVLIRAAAIGIDRSSNRLMRLRPSLETSSC